MLIKIVNYDVIMSQKVTNYVVIMLKHSSYIRLILILQKVVKLDYQVFLDIFFVYARLIEIFFETSEEGVCQWCSEI